MSNPNTDVLNDITETLIDSQKGYEKACELAHDNRSLQNIFRKLAAERKELVAAFQDRVRDYGETPVTSGGTGGRLHRAWADFSAFLESDEKAALDAVDDGEDYLSDRVETKMKTEGLDETTRGLLQQARDSARYGETFADYLTDH